MQYQLPIVQTAVVNQKRVFLLSDLDVPLDDKGMIIDDMRLQNAVPTIDWLLLNGATIIVAGKLGRPGGHVVEELSLEPIARWFKQHIATQEADIKKTTIGECNGWQIEKTLFLLENLRFNPGEEANDVGFVKKLAALAEVYVNDAFSLSHRAHASVAGVPKFLAHYAGLHLQKEIATLQTVLTNPKRPLVVIIGGKKIETKLPLVTKMYSIADYILVGGKIAQEKETLHAAHSPKYHAKLLVAQTNETGNDITEESVNAFCQIISRAKTIVWNGTMGLIQITQSASRTQNQDEDTEKGTREIAEAISKSSAYSVIGGGDTVEYIRKLGFSGKFGFVSTGGGAMLTLLSGEKLPGLEALIAKT